MGLAEIGIFVGTSIILIGGAFVFLSDGIQKASPLLMLGFLIAGGSLLYQIVTSPNEGGRYISSDEKRAAKMFTQNCKQVNYIQANNTTGLGLGVTTKGSPVVGAVSSSNEDSYVYSCDGGVQYTLTYDIEKYRQYYK
ncbi:hypothetical protein GHT89_16630 [Acinetobacter baumannii]|uniref:hypothetical protein n=1 Tax=Acinetobacter baumannii TaxID=470 RepID=UPI00387DC1A9